MSGVRWRGFAVVDLPPTQAPILPRKTVKPATMEWLNVSMAPPLAVRWREGPIEYTVVDGGARAFVARCKAFLPDPRRQATVDISRASVRLGAMPIDDVNDLDALVDRRDWELAAVLATQVVVAEAYEMAALAVPAGWIVAERHPPSRMRIVLGCAGHPARIVAVRVCKRMRALHPDTGREAAVDLRVDGDLATDRLTQSVARVVAHTSEQRRPRRP